MRAYQKKVIFLKNTGTDSFEEAYFVISDRVGEDKSSKDMVDEAKKIIKESFGKKRRKVFSFFRPGFLLPFSLGAVISSLILFTLYFTVS